MKNYCRIFENNHAMYIEHEVKPYFFSLNGDLCMCLHSVVLLLHLWPWPTYLAQLFRSYKTRLPLRRALTLRVGNLTWFNILFLTQFHGAWGQKVLSVIFPILTSIVVSIMKSITIQIRPRLFLYYFFLLRRIIIIWGVENKKAIPWGVQGWGAVTGAAGRAVAGRCVRLSGGQEGLK